jgi:hypothetical protein
MTMTLDFDVVELDTETLSRAARRHGVRVTRVDLDGPGGGNPRVLAVASSRSAARAFLREVYGNDEDADEVLEAQ